ncbi:molybdopterin-dependent oxidoreductase [Amycolatopsis sp. PS_44_ISF1]|uniref:molybdopterin-dependent oxidoreductase n=1 Tax=Amycolatopsis sp. PS_44_ISF1 TaxID=2974917 RepID=UPI0028DFF0B0|nr:molybdopterin-dependent oxidoreductase [Amycolatopsis sp. PS_44_ISF1]MDT8911293.1 molybdopterin-dependent oxidoreductase [Amycolatopsis sp. PS_44_ISF1]
MMLALTFSVCFVTGLLSHLIQHPPEWFSWPSRPIWLYRVTQGAHVISGIASIPLLLAKLWSVFPKLFGRPVVRSLPHALERLSILVLSGSAFFELSTGLLNVAQNYPWGFYFPQVHYAVAWLAIGSILVHIAVKLPVVRRALTREPAAGPQSLTAHHEAGAAVASPADADPESGIPPPDHPSPPAPTLHADHPDGLSRRGFLRTTWIATGAAVIATAGATVPLLRNVSGLSWRTGKGTQGLPVNRTAVAAGVMQTARDPSWQLSIVTPAGTKKFSLEELRALPQTTVELPIACVEGWSQSAVWRGITMPSLLRAAGSRPGVNLQVSSLEKAGIYRVTMLPGEHTGDDDTLLALELNGEVLDLDHGFPCRIIAPSRPGVLQTKWVSKLEVR